MKQSNAEVGNLWETTAAAAPETQPLLADVDCDLVIIGAGFTGCSAALHAAERGLSVRVLEAETIGHGGSGRNVGLVNAGLWLTPDQVDNRLGTEAGAQLYRVLSRAPDVVFDLVERHKIPCDAIRNGTLHCAASPRHLRDLQDRCGQNIRRGAPLQLLDRAQAQARTGSDTFHGALFDPRAGTIQPLSYCRGLARAAIQAGAVIHESCPAARVAEGPKGWCVQAGGQELRSRFLLIATNAYHQALLGIAPPQWAPVHYFQMATEPLPEKLLRDILPGQEGCWDTALVMSSVRRDAHGRVIVGGIGDPSHRAGGIHQDWARRKLRQIYPQLGNVQLEHCWHGRISMTGDHIPKLQRVGGGGYAVFGYSGRGIGPGTVFGRAMAQVFVSGSEDDLPLSPVQHYGEAALGLKRAYYEAGALATHLIAARGR